MEKNELRLWAVTVLQALQGDEESKQILEAKNREREEQGLPSIEEELRSATKENP